ncbi:hypothetical protein [Mesorhizobium australicum]|uniref:Uncharacterized protein n=1 Tax=Mesorhizobium australicum TaxID=536018 RepID=A0A1X7PCI1_9HYPH|nr:hypothetical protein [Mesorhizobium australicum]SMH48051.1 hypothetical protein SAMN02982922_3666 [Mesorhizobium australicum]
MASISKTIFASLVLSAFVGASMAQGQQPPSTTPVPVAPAGAGGSNLGTAQLFAVVSANGSVSRGKGEASAIRVSAGYYRVGFYRNIAACAYVATVGGVAAEVVTGIANVTRMTGNNSNVFVRTFALNGTAADRSFHLYIDC